MLIVLQGAMLQTSFGSNRDFSIIIRIDIGPGNVLTHLFDMSESAPHQTINKAAPEAQAADQSPLDFLPLLVQVYGRFNEAWRAKLDRQMMTMKCRWRMISIDTIALQFDRDEKYAYAELTRDLHAGNTDLVFLSHVLDFELEPGALCL